MSNLSYKRFLVKFSGESVAGKEGIGIDPKILDEMAASINFVLNYSLFHQGTHQRHK